MKKVFWSKCKMFRNLHSFHGAFVCSDTYLRVTSLSASYPLSARHFPICEALPYLQSNPYLRATLYLRGTSLSWSHPLSASNIPICEPPSICESLPYLGATPYLRATSLSASHPLSVSHFPIWEPPPLCTILESHNFDYSLRQTWLNLISLMSQEICAVIILALSWAAVPSYNKSHIFSGIF